MHKLMTELRRLYLPATALARDAFEQHLSGQQTHAVSLQAADGQSRAMVIAFDRQAGDEGGQHWALLCEVANAMQSELGLPAPAVSISGDRGYGLWLSLEQPVAPTVAGQFLESLRRAYFPHIEANTLSLSAPVELPPCLHMGTRRWAAFINPGLGASFADESGLEMAPPLAGQVALLEGVHSISAKQFQHALGLLQAAPPAQQPAPAATGLLLRDASLEDIVRHLHALNIEPTFRHLIKAI